MMIKYIRTQRIMPLYGVSTNIILSSYHSLYTPLNYKINYYNNININNLSFPSLSTPKFFSTVTNDNNELITGDLSDIRRILNVAQIEKKNQLELQRWITKYIQVLNIIEKYYIEIDKTNISTNMLLHLLNYEYSLDNLNLRHNYFKKFVKYYLSLKINFTSEDLNNIKFILKDTSDSISNSAVLDDNIIKISKQTAFFEGSPINQAVEVLLNECTDNVETQLEIEKLLNISWIEVLNKNIKDLKAGEKTVINESFKLLHEYIIEYEFTLENVRKSNYELQQNKKYELTLKPLYEVDLKTISVIVFNIIIPILSSVEGAGRNELIMKIGDQLFHRWALKIYEDKYIIEKIKNKIIWTEDRPTFREFKLNLNISPTNKGDLGEILLFHLIKMGSLIETEIVPTSGSKVESRVIPSESSVKLFEKSFDLVGFKLPMICPPRAWSPSEDGGYLLNNQYFFNDLIHQGINNVTPTIIDKKNDIYEQINHMSCVPFKINKNVLNFVLKYGEQMGLIKGSLHKKTLEMNALETPKEKKDFFSKLPSEVKQDMLAHNSQYYQEKNILGIAKLYSNVDRFYFPLFYDWRGRIYNDCSYLNYQSSSLAKALLMFADGKSMKVINKFDLPNSLEFIGLPDLGFKSDFWLKIYGANCFGNGNGDEKNLNNLKLDKLPYKDRILWIENHHSDIISLNPDFWNQADQELLFLAFCYEYKAYYEDPENFITHLPIQLDATCNGLQHLSVMSANSKLAQLVNLLPNSEDQNPFDLYSVVLAEIEKKVKKIIDENPLHVRLKYLKLDRKIVKRSIMTIPYNVTENGIVEHLKEFFYVNINKKKDDSDQYVYEYMYSPKKEKIHGSVAITGGDLFMLAKIIYNVLYEVHPELKNVVSYFKNMVNLLTKLELPVVWITPGGLIIKQKYAKKKSDRVRSGLFKGADYTIVIPTGKIDKVSQQNAFMPNLIHSMDGSTITLLAKRLKTLGIKNIYTIHDCFATTADNVSIINELVREAFCEIYSDERFLLKLHQFFIQYIHGNFKIVYEDIEYKKSKGEKSKKILKDTLYVADEWISQEDALTKTFKVLSPSGWVEIPKLPKTGNLTDLKNNIQKAIYMIN
jgi:hypothetical protein